VAETPKKIRTLSGRWDVAVKIMMGATALYYVWASTVGVVSLQYYRGIAVLYSLVVPLLLYKGWKRGREDRPTIVDLLLALSATASVVYWIVEHEAMAYRAGDYSTLDVGMGIIATIVAIEAIVASAIRFRSRSGTSSMFASSMAFCTSCIFAARSIGAFRITA